MTETPAAGVACLACPEGILWPSGTRPPALHCDSCGTVLYPDEKPPALTAIRVPGGPADGRREWLRPQDAERAAKTDSFLAVTQELAEGGRHRRERPGRARHPVEQLDRPDHPAWQALWRGPAFLVLHGSRLIEKILPGWADARMAGIRRRFERQIRKNLHPGPVATITVRPDGLELSRRDTERPDPDE